MIKNIDQLLQMALSLDGADKDPTSSAIISPKQQCTATFITKLPGISCGTEEVKRLFELVNPSINVDILKEDGRYLSKGDAIICVQGKMIDILRISRVACSILDVMGSVAYVAGKYADEIKDLPCQLTTNYKSIPLFEPLIKKALALVNVEQPNSNLQDYCYLNEAHILTIGSLGDAINQLRKKNLTQPIEAEVINLNEAMDAINLGVERIILKDMILEEMQECLKLKREKTLIGTTNLSIGRVREFAKMGFDYLTIDDLALNMRSMGIYLKVYKRTLK